MHACVQTRAALDQTYHIGRADVITWFKNRTAVSKKRRGDQQGDGHQRGSTAHLWQPLPQQSIGAVVPAIRSLTQEEGMELARLVDAQSRKRRSIIGRGDDGGGGGGGGLAHPACAGGGMQQPDPGFNISYASYPVQQPQDGVAPLDPTATTRLTQRGFGALLGPATGGLTQMLQGDAPLDPTATNSQLLLQRQGSGAMMQQQGHSRSVNASFNRASPFSAGQLSLSTQAATASVASILPIAPTGAFFSAGATAASVLPIAPTGTMLRLMSAGQHLGWSSGSPRLTAPSHQRAVLGADTAAAAQTSGQHFSRNGGSPSRLTEAWSGQPLVRQQPPAPSSSYYGGPHCRGTPPLVQAPVASSSSRRRWPQRGGLRPPVPRQRHDAGASSHQHSSVASPSAYENKNDDSPAPPSRCMLGPAVTEAAVAYLAPTGMAVMGLVMEPAPHEVQNHEDADFSRRSSLALIASDDFMKFMRGLVSDE